MSRGRAIGKPRDFRHQLVDPAQTGRIRLLPQGMQRQQDVFATVAVIATVLGGTGPLATAFAGAGAEIILNGRDQEALDIEREHSLAAAQA